MEDGNLFDTPSPSHSYLYACSDQGRFLDASRSDSQSSATSPYDTAFSGDFAGSRSTKSPDVDGEPGSPLPQDEASAAQLKSDSKRKRENRYKNAPPSVLSRRRAQNRASQRAYRERKDQRIKDLEQLLNDANLRNDVLGQAYADLQAEYLRLKASVNNEDQNPGPYSVSPDMGGYLDPHMPTHGGHNLGAYIYAGGRGFPV